MNRFYQTILLVVLALLFSACAGSLSTQLRQNELLPTVKNIKNIPDINKIAFEWKPIYSPNIQGYRIYRAQANQGLFSLLANIPSRYISHYIDKNLKPNTQYIYKMTTYSQNNEESLKSKLVKTNTLNLLSPVSYIKAVVLPLNSIKILWRPHPNKRIHGYLVERSDSTDNPNWNHQFYIDDRLSAEFVDSNLAHNHQYIYRVVAQTFDNINSYASKPVYITTKPLPHIVKNVRASQDLDNAIKIYWSSNNEDNIDYYKVYQNGTFFDTLLAKTRKTHYTHVVTPGMALEYKVTAVSIDGLESMMQPKPILGQSHKPAPKINELTQ